MMLQSRERGSRGFKRVTDLGMHVGLVDGSRLVRGAQSERRVCKGSSGPWLVDRLGIRCPQPSLCLGGSSVRGRDPTSGSDRGHYAVQTFASQMRNLRPRGVQCLAKLDR